MRAPLLYLLLSTCLIITSGCTAVGVGAYKLMGPPAVPAMYIPAKEPLVVMVENYRRPSSAYTDDQLLTRYIEGYLRGHDVAPIVESANVADLRVNHPEEFKKMSVAAIGREVGAKQILYVDVIQSDVETLMAGEALRGATAVRVKVVDAQSGETRWPGDMAEGYPLEQSVQFHKNKASNEQDLKAGIYAQLGDRIAKLFYKWKPENQDPEGFVGD
jgi:hypothetical protein